jgi:hypothetical protein
VRTCFFSKVQICKWNGVGHRLKKFRTYSCCCLELRELSGERFCQRPRQTTNDRFLESSRTCKPNSVCRIAPAGRPFLWATHYCAAQATYPKVWRAEPARARPKAFGRASSLFGLAPCGVCHARSITGTAVRSYRTFSPLPDVAAKAVCFLWHLPSTGFETSLPDVIRHTALRSSDFPLPPRRGESGRPVQLPT